MTETGDVSMNEEVVSPLPSALPLPAAPGDPWWVLAGLPAMGRRPMMVVLPLLVTMALWLLAIGSGIAVIYWWWPSWAESTFWSWLLDVVIALSAGALIAGSVATIVLPVLMGLVWEKTVARVTRDRGIETPGETTIAGRAVGGIGFIADDAVANWLAACGIYCLMGGAAVGPSHYLVGAWPYFNA